MSRVADAARKLICLTCVQRRGHLKILQTEDEAAAQIVDSAQENATRCSAEEAKTWIELLDQVNAHHSIVAGSCSAHHTIQIIVETNRSGPPSVAQRWVSAKLEEGGLEAQMDPNTGLPAGFQLLSTYMSMLRKLCRMHLMLPGSFMLPLDREFTMQLRNEEPYRCGGFADVWKVTYHGQDVAYKVIRASTGAPRKAIEARITHRFQLPPH